jgi:hypothetical protein
MARQQLPLTSFSPSPTHLLVREAAEMAKKVALLSAASALASSVLPLPGGPYSRMPRTGARRPVKRSARRLCQQGMGRGGRCI